MRFELATLSLGSAGPSPKLQDYFTGNFRAEDFGEEFPVNLEQIWCIGFPRKGHAVRTLRKKFMEDVDCQLFLTNAENLLVVRPEAIFHLTVSFLEYLTVQANREMFEIYRACSKLVRSLVSQFCSYYVQASATSVARRGGEE